VTGVIERSTTVSSQAAALARIAKSRVPSPLEDATSLAHIPLEDADRRVCCVFLDMLALNDFLAV